jgi:flagellar biosynthesis GTPase FlhF
MRLKSYFAGTVESAMYLARQEMGEDALLVNSRKAPPEARHLGEYEVVFAIEAPAAEFPGSR